MNDRVAEAGARVNGQVEELMRRMNAKAVFGEPIQQGDVTLIPVASVMYGFGMGQGWGRSPKAAEEGAPAGEGGEAATPNEGAGAGGGGGGVAKPLGYIRIDAEGAHWEPAMDTSRISLAGIFMAAWSVFWVMKTIRTVVKAVAGRKGCC